MKAGSFASIALAVAVLPAAARQELVPGDVAAGCIGARSPTSRSEHDDVLDACAADRSASSTIAFSGTSLPLR